MENQKIIVKKGSTKEFSIAYGCNKCGNVFGGGSSIKITADDTSDIELEVHVQKRCPNCGATEEIIEIPKYTTNLFTSLYKHPLVKSIVKISGLNTSLYEQNPFNYLVSPLEVSLLLNNAASKHIDLNNVDLTDFDISFIESIVYVVSRYKMYRGSDNHIYPLLHFPKDVNEGIVSKMHRYIANIKREQLNQYLLDEEKKTIHFINSLLTSAIEPADKVEI